MSVVCAKVYDDRIEIAADSGVFIGETIMPSNGNSDKLFEIVRFENERFPQRVIVGGVGALAETNLLKHFLMNVYTKIIEPNYAGILETMSAFYEYSKLLHENDPSNANAEDQGNSFLIIVGRKLFYVSALDIMEITSYFAIGAGQEYAFASLASGASPVDAVKVAASLCVYVREPVVHYEVEK